MPATFNRARAEEVLLPVIKQYIQSKGLYAFHHKDTGTAPQKKHIPKGMVPGTPEHIQFLFFTTALTLQSVSDESFRLAVRVYARHPEFFDFSRFPVEEDTIKGVLRETGFQRWPTWGRNWYRLQNDLKSYFDGDPLRFAREFKTVDDFLVFKKKTGSFPGFGPKIMSLFYIFLGELGVLSPPRDAFPVDVHVQRISITTGMVTIQGARIDATELAEILRGNLAEFALAHTLSTEDLSHALWFLGSKLCTRCKHSTAPQVLCPVYTLCGGVIETKPYWRKGYWDMGLPLCGKAPQKALL